MKIPESLLLSLVLAAAASAQTNTFPASGHVGTAPFVSRFPTAR
jgi:hypothetical protein